MRTHRPRIHKCEHTCPCKHQREHMNMNTQVYTTTHAYAHALAHVCVCACANTCSATIDWCTCSHKHDTNTHAYMHTDTQQHVWTCTNMCVRHRVAHVCRTTRACARMRVHTCTHAHNGIELPDTIKGAWYAYTKNMTRTHGCMPSMHTTRATPRKATRTHKHVRATQARAYARVYQHTHARTHASETSHRAHDPYNYI